MALERKQVERTPEVSAVEAPGVGPGRANDEAEPRAVAAHQPTRQRQRGVGGDAGDAVSHAQQLADENARERCACVTHWDGPLTPAQVVAYVVSRNRPGKRHMHGQALTGTGSSRPSTCSATTATMSA